MTDVTSPISEDRPLTRQEESLVRWLIEHGGPGTEAYLPQIPQARVVSRCSCGCASIDFAIAGKSPSADDGMKILSDYWWQAADGALFGVFAFARGGLLAGLEVWPIDGEAATASLPTVEELQPLDIGPR
jgi:hypothetical protein